MPATSNTTRQKASNPSGKRIGYVRVSSVDQNDGLRPCVHVPQ